MNYSKFRSLRTVILIAAIAAGLTSCKDDDGIPPDGPDTDKDGNSLIVTPQDLDFPAAGGSKTIQITANVEWKIVSSDQSWCNLSTLSGMNDASITVNVAAHTGTSDRNAALTISNSTYGLSKTITVTQQGKPSSNDQYDIYVAGNNKDGYATYWKNGVAFVNTNVQDTYKAIAVSNGDVYTLYGKQGGSSGVDFYYCKNNGTPVTISGGYIASNIAVSNNTVYVSGSAPGNKAMYWVNGTATMLSAPNSTYSFANEITISNGNVYIAGEIGYSSSPAYYAAGYWRNGSAVTVEGGSIGNNAFAYCIDVSGNDVYLGGSKTDGTKRATYWKNGNAVRLNNSGGASEVSRIAVSNNGDIHAVGYHGRGQWHVTHWKNDVEYFVFNTGNTNPTTLPSTRVYLVGDDVWIRAAIGDVNYYWKNGVEAKFIEESGAIAMDVVAVPR